MELEEGNSIASHLAELCMVHASGDKTSDTIQRYRETFHFVGCDLVCLPFGGRFLTSFHELLNKKSFFLLSFISQIIGHLFSN
jgi:hypothetical protein